jgi:hypothetical protein
VGSSNGQLLREERVWERVSDSQSRPNTTINKLDCKKHVFLQTLCLSKLKGNLAGLKRNGACSKKFEQALFTVLFVAYIKIILPLSKLRTAFITAMVAMTLSVVPFISILGNMVYLVLYYIISGFYTHGGGWGILGVMAILGLPAVALLIYGGICSFIGIFKPHKICYSRVRYLVRLHHFFDYSNSVN